MELWEFEDLALDWCHKHGYLMRTVEFEREGILKLDIHYYEVIKGYFGNINNPVCYSCFLNDDMTFKNVPYGLKGKVRGKKLIV